MSKVDLTSLEWCELIFKDRNKNYGAYKMRRDLGRRQTASLVIVTVVAFAGFTLPRLVKMAMPEQKEEMVEVTQLSALEEPEVKEETLKKSINPQKKNLPDGETEKALEEKGTKPAEKQKTEKAVFAKGTWYAQIIASSSRKAVQSLWNNLSAKHTFLKSYPYEIEEIKVANGNTLYRLKVGVFKTREEAAASGSRLKKNQISSIIKQN